MNLILAWLVHLYSAIGSVLAFLTLFLISQTRFQEALGLMALSVLIDATDGTLARKVRVKEVLPWFDGDRLEDIVDYLTYVFVPCAFLVWAQLLPQGIGLMIVGLPLLASAYGFCQKEAKSEDHYFLGFPSYWNIIVFYFYVLGTSQWFNVWLIVFCSVFIFVPIKYLYPSRSPVLRGLTICLGIFWGGTVLAVIYRLPEPSYALAFSSLLFPAYYLVLSFWLEARRRGYFS